WSLEAGVVDGPLFRTVDRAGRILPSRCSDRAVARAVQRAVRSSGGDPRRVGAHSLRSGFVTSAARAGAPTSDIWTWGFT
ncbi:MAG: integrase, partial [Candidatus Dormibacteria bacterium]